MSLEGDIDGSLAAWQLEWADDAASQPGSDSDGATRAPKPSRQQSPRVRASPTGSGWYDNTEMSESPDFSAVDQAAEKLCAATSAGVGSPEFDLVSCALDALLGCPSSVFSRPGRASSTSNDPGYNKSAIAFAVAEAFGTRNPQSWQQQQEARSDGPLRWLHAGGAPWIPPDSLALLRTLGAAMKLGGDSAASDMVAAAAANAALCAVTAGPSPADGSPGSRATLVDGGLNLLASAAARAATRAASEGFVPCCVTAALQQTCSSGIVSALSAIAEAATLIAWLDWASTVILRASLDVTEKSALARLAPVLSDALSSASSSSARPTPPPVLECFGATAQAFARTLGDAAAQMRQRVAALQAFHVEWMAAAGVDIDGGAVLFAGDSARASTQRSTRAARVELREFDGARRGLSTECASPNGVLPRVDLIVAGSVRALPESVDPRLTLSGIISWLHEVCGEEFTDLVSIARGVFWAAPPCVKAEACKTACSPPQSLSPKMPKSPSASAAARRLRHAAARALFSTANDIPRIIAARILDMLASATSCAAARESRKPLKRGSHSTSQTIRLNLCDFPPAKISSGTLVKALFDCLRAYTSAADAFSGGAAPSRELPIEAGGRAQQSQRLLARWLRGAAARCGAILAHFDETFASPRSPIGAEEGRAWTLAQLPSEWTDTDGDGEASDASAVRALMLGIGPDDDGASAMSASTGGGRSVDDNEPLHASAWVTDPNWVISADGDYGDGGEGTADGVSGFADGVDGAATDPTQWILRFDCCPQFFLVHARARKSDSSPSAASSSPVPQLPRALSALVALRYANAVLAAALRENAEVGSSRTRNIKSDSPLRAAKNSLKASRAGLCIRASTLAGAPTFKPLAQVVCNAISRSLAQAALVEAPEEAGFSNADNDADFDAHSTATDSGGVCSFDDYRSESDDNDGEDIHDLDDHDGDKNDDHGDGVDDSKKMPYAGFRGQLVSAVSVVSKSPVRPPLPPKETSDQGPISNAPSRRSSLTSLSRYHDFPSDASTFSGGLSSMGSSSDSSSVTGAVKPVRARAVLGAGLAPLSGAKISAWWSIDAQVEVPKRDKDGEETISSRAESLEVVQPPLPISQMPANPRVPPRTLDISVIEEEGNEDEEDIDGDLRIVEEVPMSLPVSHGGSVVSASDDTESQLDGDDGEIEESVAMPPRSEAEQPAGNGPKTAISSDESLWRLGEASWERLTAIVKAVADDSLAVPAREEWASLRFEVGGTEEVNENKAACAETMACAHLAGEPIARILARDVAGTVFARLETLSSAVVAARVGDVISVATVLRAVVLGADNSAIAAFEERVQSALRVHADVEALGGSSSTFSSAAAAAAAAGARSSVHLTAWLRSSLESGGWSRTDASAFFVQMESSLAIDAPLAPEIAASEALRVTFTPPRAVAALVPKSFISRLGAAGSMLARLRVSLARLNSLARGARVVDATVDHGLSRLEALPQSSRIFIQLRTIAATRATALHAVNASHAHIARDALDVPWPVLISRSAAAKDARELSESLVSWSELVERATLLAPGQESACAALRALLARVSKLVAASAAFYSALVVFVGVAVGAGEAAADAECALNGPFEKRRRYQLDATAFATVADAYVPVQRSFAMAAAAGVALRRHVEFLARAAATARSGGGTAASGFNSLVDELRGFNDFFLG
jgi:hypothetical protein